APSAGLAVDLDEGVGRRVEGLLRVLLSGQYGQELARLRLAEFDAPLAERVEPEDRSLGEDDVLVQRDELAKDPGGEGRGEVRPRRAVPGHVLVWCNRGSHVIGTHLLLGAAESENAGLCEEVGDEQVVHGAGAVRGREVVARTGLPDEIERNQVN